MDVKIGDLLDNKYRIVRLLGQGGMGAVYEGQNVRIHHRVAIKVLHPGVATSSEVVQRFEREAQAAGQIGSDHIVEVYDLGELEGGARYMVMEFLEGETLASAIRRLGRLTPAQAAGLMLQILEGLGAAHAAGIVHRDLKPDNIFLHRTKADPSFVKIVDFGVSKFNSLSGAGGSMTRTGLLVGTPYYMPPEQLKGSKYTDYRSDLYSAGVVLFEAVTGQVPFQAETFNELMYKIVFEDTPDPAAVLPGLDPGICAIVRTAMTRDVARRFQSAADFAQAIIQWMGGSLAAGAAAAKFETMPPPRAPMATNPGEAGGMPSRATPAALSAVPGSMAMPGITPIPGSGSPLGTATPVSRPPPGRISSGTIVAPDLAQLTPTPLSRSTAGSGLVGPVASATGSGARRGLPVGVWFAVAGFVLISTAVGSTVMIWRGKAPAVSTAPASQGAAPEHVGLPPPAVKPPEPPAQPSTVEQTPPTVALAPPSAAPSSDEEKHAPAAADEAHAAHPAVAGPALHHHPAEAAAAASGPTPIDTATLRGRTVHTKL